MKVIDLLNKIANGEESRLTYHKFSQDDYCTVDDFFSRYIVDEENLNLEIIEDTPKEDKKIAKLDVVLLGQCDNWLQPTIDTDKKIRAELNPYIIDVIKENTLVMQRKINEIIDKINGEHTSKKIEQIGKSYNIREYSLKDGKYTYDMEKLIEMVQDIYDKQYEIIKVINGE